ncbi:MAG: DUF2235 domain-containing protein [Alphaproteobacteria bacterium]|nr:DUF2235 domain-containing protein [Alphaproteobacteria bacterium]MBU1562308.1 DUF2235 domain-containing protein [Alphaproteobacteria bacterium]MBU2302720.1 DUF2235 domain-containing protein [Alphaproteobacteria bacterium]MBU2369289.1 DUF2235 domain-containing protein [Alphaproteobacteria bacterium]
MKRLVIFCDGTWNRMSAEHPTNVLTASQLVLPKDAADIPQITYYDEGVGTSFLVNEWLETRLAGAFGWGLLDKIEAAYRFLIFNYEPGDEIFIFGFSRGAYTARSLAGLIRKCGIVPRTHARSIREIFEFYKDAGTHPDSDEAQRRRMMLSPQTIFKEEDRKWRIDHGADATTVAAAKPLVIRYLGVWDTVGALGVPQHLIISSLFGTAKKYQFHDTALSSTVQAARHAVATDEDRLSFAPALWSNLDVLNSANGEGQRYQQLWFPGDHGSVGGGGDVRGLSNEALAWIMEGAAAEGLALDATELANIKAEADPLAPLSNQSKAPGLFDRIYRRVHRDGPQQGSLLADSTRLRLAYETKSADWKPYRPLALKRIWPTA